MEVWPEKMCMGHGVRFEHIAALVAWQGSPDGSAECRRRGCSAVAVKALQQATMKWKWCREASRRTN